MGGSARKAHCSRSLPVHSTHISILQQRRASYAKCLSGDFPNSRFERAKAVKSHTLYVRAASTILHLTRTTRTQRGEERLVHLFQMNSREHSQCHGCSAKSMAHLARLCSGERFSAVCTSTFRKGNQILFLGTGTHTWPQARPV